MISLQDWLVKTVPDMLAERAKLSKEFWLVSGSDIVNMATQAYAAMFDKYEEGLRPERSPGEMLQRFVANLDAMGPKSRVTLLAFLEQRYSRVTGEKTGEVR